MVPSRHIALQCLAEFLGTAVLVFLCAGSLMLLSMADNLPSSVIAGAVAGTALAVLIWCLSGVSGAHLNPAFTLILMIFDGLPGDRAVKFILSQLFGSALASTLLYTTLGLQGAMGANLPNSAAGVSFWTAFVAECLLSFVMMLVIRGSLAAQSFRRFAAIPIGAIVGVEVMLMGSITGAAMNPARAFGPYIYLGQWGSYWIYVAGPIIGMAAAAMLWRWVCRCRD